MLKIGKSEKNKSYTGYEYESKEVHFPKSKSSKLDINIDGKNVGLPKHQQINLADYSNNRPEKDLICHQFTEKITGEIINADPTDEGFWMYHSNDERTILKEKDLKVGQPILFGRNWGKPIWKMTEILHSGIYIGGSLVFQSLGGLVICVMDITNTMGTYGAEFIYKRTKKDKDEISDS